MAFVILEEKEPYWYEVEIPVPDSRGHAKKHKVKLKFKRVDRDELEEIANRARERREGDETQGQMNDALYIQDIAEDWEGFSNEKGPLKFTPDNVLMVVKRVPSFPLAAIRAWNEANYQGGIKEKN